MEQYVKGLIKELNAPAAAVVVIENNKVVVNDAYGMADVENQVPATNKSVFRLASLTKHITALAILKLVEQGKLILEASVAQLLPQYANIDDRITVEMLLNHTSGLVNYTDLEEFEGAFSLVDQSHDDMLAFFLKEPLNFEPGSQFSYCNSGYYLLGVLIETLSGQTYDEFLKESFFRPLGMTQTCCDDTRKIIPHRARGYSSEHGATPESGLLNAEYGSMKAPFAAGGLCSSADDLVKWSQAMLKGDLVDAALLKRAHTPPDFPNGATSNYGFGIASFEKDGVKMLGHDGGIMGFSSDMLILPEQQSAVIVLANDDCSEPAMISRRIVSERFLASVEPA